MTEDELLAAIQVALSETTTSHEPNTVTTNEAALLMSCGEARARDLLKRAAAAGKVLPDWILRTDSWGSTQRVKGWRFVQE